MAGYTRQSETDIQATNVVKAKSLNDEYDQLLAAFNNSSGHSHDGTAAEGGPITVMKDADGDTKIQVEESADEDTIRFDIAGTEQIVLADGVLKPTTDNDIDLGTSSLEFKDGYFDGTIHVDTLDVDVNATVAGTLGVTGTTTLAGILSLPDGSASAPSITNTGDTNAGLFFSASDEIAFTAGGTAQVIFADGSIAPETDNDIDLGSASYEFKDLYLDGTAHIDTLDVDVNATVAGTLGVTGATTLGGILSIPDGSASNPSITNTGDTNCGLFFSAADEIAFTAGGTAQVIFADGSIAPQTDNDIDLGSSSYEFKDLYLDGTAHIDTLDVDVNATVAGTLGVTGAITGSSTGTFSGILKTDDTTDATSTTDGSLQTDGGLSVAKDAVLGNDLKLLSDAAFITFGTSSGVSLQHHPSALRLNSSNQLQFGDVGTYIHQSADGVLDLVSDTEIEINATTIDINGNADVSGTLVVAGESTLAATSFGDANITNVGNIALDSISADGTDINVAVTDNSATAFTVKQGSDAYLIVDTANSSESVAIGTGVNGTAISIGHTTSETTVNDNLTVTGDLTVNGTTTTVDTTNIAIKDSLMELNSGASTGNDSGIIIQRGSTGNDALIMWDESADKWTLGTTTSTGTSTGDLNITTGTLVADLEGTASTATVATTVTITDNESEDEDNAIIFTAGGDVDGGNLGLESDGNLTYNPSTGKLSSTLISGGIQTALIEFTDGDNAITIADGGGITANTSLTLASGSTVTAIKDEDDMNSNSNSSLATQQSIKAYVDTVAATSNNVTGLTASGAELNVLDGASAGTIVNSKGVIYSSGGVVNATSLSIAGTALTATAAEFNLLDGGSTVGTTTVASGDGILTNDGTVMRQTNVDTFDTYFSGTTKTLTNKTLTSPVLTTPKFADGGFIADANGAEMLVFQTVSSAANALEITNAAASGAVVIGAMGSDTNVDINITPKGTGEVNIAAGNLNYASTAITATGAELNILDGDVVTVGTTAVADGDGIVTNDGGTMRQTTVQTFATYFASEITAMSNLVTTGALNSGSITSGFGTINTGSSAITTTGTVNFGSLADGTITVTAFVDEDNMSSDSATLVPTQQSVKKYVDDSVASAASKGFSIAMAIVFG